MKPMRSARGVHTTSCRQFAPQGISENPCDNEVMASLGLEPEVYAQNFSDVLNYSLVSFTINVHRYVGQSFYKSLQISLNIQK